jgi:hypothetical protein
MMEKKLRRDRMRTEDTLDNASRKNNSMEFYL